MALLLGRVFGFLAGRRKPDGRTPQSLPILYAIEAHAPPVGVRPRRSLEVLHNGGEVELIASAGETPKAHAAEAMLPLQMCKAHFCFLARIARSLELGRALERPGMVTRTSLMSRAIFLNGARVHRRLSVQVRHS